MATTNELEVCGQAELTAFKAALCEAGRPDLAELGWSVSRNVFWAGFSPMEMDEKEVELLTRAVVVAHVLHDRRAHVWRNDYGKIRDCCPTCCAAALRPRWKPCPTHPL